MPDNTDDDTLRAILENTKTIAMVGASLNPVRPSLFVATYMGGRKYRVIPINPGHAGKTLLGETVIASLSDIPKDTQVDMVDIFRNSNAVPGVVDEAIDHLMPGLKYIWMQYNVWHEEAAEKARAAGLTVVQDRCPKVEHMRLLGGTNLAGLGGGRISSKLRPLR